MYISLVFFSTKNLEVKCGLIMSYLRIITNLCCPQYFNNLQTDTIHRLYNLYNAYRYLSIFLKFEMRPVLNG